MVKLNNDQFDDNNKKEPTPFDNPDSKDDIEMDAAKRISELFKNFAGKQVPKLEPTSTADIVEAWLKRNELHYQRLDQPGHTMFLLTFSDDDSGISVFTRIVCYKHLVSWFMSCPPKEHVKDAEKAKIVALVACSLDYAIAGIDTVFDPSDGEWGVRICMSHVESDHEFGDALTKMRQLYICVRNAVLHITEKGDTDWQPLAMASLASFQTVTTLFDRGPHRDRSGLLKLLKELVDFEDSDSSDEDDTPEDDKPDNDTPEDVKPGDGDDSDR